MRSMSPARRDRARIVAQAYAVAYDSLRQPLPSGAVGLEIAAGFTAVVRELYITCPRHFLAGVRRESPMPCPRAVIDAIERNQCQRVAESVRGV